jgi:hypothetical protein
MLDMNFLHIRAREAREPQLRIRAQVLDYR